MGLRRKRARIAGEIERLEQKAAPLRESLAQVDALLRLFEGGDPELIPAIKPAPRCLFFRHGEQQRLCLAALREAQGPQTARWVAEWAMGAKGLLPAPWAVRNVFISNMRTALKRLEKRGLVRRVMREPEGWWEVCN